MDGMITRHNPIHFLLTPSILLLFVSDKQDALAVVAVSLDAERSFVLHPSFL